MPKASKIIFVFWAIILPIVIGALCYILLKPANTVLHHYLQNWFSFPAIKQHYIAANYIPDFCWAFSLCNSLLVLFKPTKTNSFYWLWVVVVLVLTEAIQVLVPKQFTFDWYDILVLVFAAFCSYILSLKI